MSDVILVSGASTGIGNLTARALARAGHTVYATMRDVGGRNAGRTRELLEWSAASGHNLRVAELDVHSQASADGAVARIVSLPAGTRPFRSVIDFIDDGAAAVTEVAERVRVELAERIGLAGLLRPTVTR